MEWGIGVINFHHFLGARFIKINFDLNIFSAISQMRLLNSAFIKSKIGQKLSINDKYFNKFYVIFNQLEPNSELYYKVTIYKKDEQM